MKKQEVRKQISGLEDLLTETLKYKMIIDSGISPVKALTGREEKLVEPKAKSNDDIINFVNKFTADYIFLKSEMDVSTPAITKGQMQRLAELNTLWELLKNEYDNLQEPLADYNILCRNSDIGKITIPGIKK